jgi:hypothetical protein
MGTNLQMEMNCSYAEMKEYSVEEDERRGAIEPLYPRLLLEKCHTSGD